MLERLLRTAAVACSAIVLVSFGLFALDETRNAANASAAAVAGLKATRNPNPTASQERARERAHTSVREAIDDADDILVTPFSPIIKNVSSSWVARGVPTLLALVVYGFGLALLAGFVRYRA
ncbi:MAG TPA: hypothetical protein VF257_05045 [Solirubrobacteraceae bacterium]